MLCPACLGATEPCHGTAFPSPIKVEIPTEPVKRDQYLSIPCVRAFVEFLRPYLIEKSFHHSYYVVKRKRYWSCVALRGAMRGYRFSVATALVRAFGLKSPAHSLSDNAVVLTRLSKDLKSAFTSNSDAKAERACCDIFRWGGTLNRNRDTVAELAREDALIGYLKACRGAFGSPHSFAYPDVPHLHSNAGFTKVYSLLFDDFAIYDSRVAASLGAFIAAFHCANKWKFQCQELRLGYMPARAYPGTPPHLRNPSHPPCTFPSVSTRPEMHLWSNVRANWILMEALSGTRFEEEVLNKWPPKTGSAKVTPLRALEAALFMIGYELKNLSLCGHSYP
jgi:hypothetical protein